MVRVMTLISLGVFLLIQAGLSLTVAGAMTRTRLLLFLGVLTMIVALGLILGIRSACGDVDSGC